MKYLYILVFLFISGPNSALASSEQPLTDTILKNNAVEEMPEFVGGMDAFYEYLENNIKWPEGIYKHLFDTGISPDPVLVSFVVEKDGRLVDIKVIKDLGLGTGEEVARVLKACPKWKPGMQNKRNVRVEFTLPVRIPPPPVMSSIRIDEPLLVSTIPIIKSSGNIKLPKISVSKEKYMFSERLSNCNLDTFRFEEEKIAVSDRYSVLQHVKESIPTDSLKNLTGRIALQLILDTSRTPCLYTYQNNLNIPFKASYFDEALTQKTKWTLWPSKNGNIEATSVILVFTFTEDRIMYQHFTFNSTYGTLEEIEIAQQGKFTKY